MNENEIPEEIPRVIDTTTPMKPFADPVMEAVFANKDVAGLAAQSLINAVLSESGDPCIGEITALTPQRVMSNPLGRGYRFDIEARVGNSELADIEIQFRRMSMNERGLLYAGRFLDDNAKRGEKIEYVLQKMPRVIIINILHFNLRGDHPDFHQPVELVYRKLKADGTYKLATDRLTIHNIELKKYVSSILPDLKTKPYTSETPSLYYWLWAMCEADSENKFIWEVVNTNTALKQFAGEDTGFRQYTERYETINDDIQVRRMYNIWTEGMSALEQVRIEGQDEGIKIGREEGRLEGRLEGHEEGRAESLLEVAMNALKQGLTVEAISSFTMLSKEKIEEIKNSISE